MAVFNRLTPYVLRKNFTHYAWLGLVPVYADLRNIENPRLIVRNWIPDCFLPLAEQLVAKLDLRVTGPLP